MYLNNVRITIFLYHIQLSIVATVGFDITRYNINEGDGFVQFVLGVDGLSERDSININFTIMAISSSGINNTSLP